MENSMAVFEDKKIRRHYDEQTEIWYFSLVDIVAALTDSSNSTDYLKKMRKRDPELNSYLGTNCPHVSMLINGKSCFNIAWTFDNSTTFTLSETWVWLHQKWGH